MLLPFWILVEIRVWYVRFTSKQIWLQDSVYIRPLLKFAVTSWPFHFCTWTVGASYTSVLGCLEATEAGSEFARGGSPTCCAQKAKEDLSRHLPISNLRKILLLTSHLYLRELEPPHPSPSLVKVSFWVVQRLNWWNATSCLSKNMFYNAKIILTRIWLQTWFYIWFRF